MALSQGSYYVLTGLWPLLHRSSFLAVTGPKVDLWLVNTVGALLAVTGLVLLVAGWRDRCSSAGS
jgi:cytochrome b subunit of formate dehydrogenase